MTSNNADWVDLGAEVSKNDPNDSTAIDFTATLSQTDPKVNVFAAKAEDAEKESKVLFKVIAVRNRFKYVCTTF